MRHTQIKKSESSSDVLLLCLPPTHNITSLSLQITLCCFLFLLLPVFFFQYGLVLEAESFPFPTLYINTLKHAYRLMLTNTHSLSRADHIWLCVPTPTLLALSCPSRLVHRCHPALSRKREYPSRNCGVKKKKSMTLQTCLTGLSSNHTEIKRAASQCLTPSLPEAALHKAVVGIILLRLLNKKTCFPEFTVRCWIIELQANQSGRGQCVKAKGVCFSCVVP